MLLTKENYFFKGGSKAALVKVMPPVCEGQLDEGSHKTIFSNILGTTYITYVFKPCIKACVKTSGLERWAPDQITFQ